MEVLRVAVLRCCISYKVSVCEILKDFVGFRRVLEDCSDIRTVKFQWVVEKIASGDFEAR